jgi:oxygen-independent coproporphyrinogen III oxidase
MTAVDSLRSLAGVTTTASRTRASTASPEGTSLYVHVPFCVVKCGYCDFNSYVVEDDAVHDSFLDALDAELARVWPGGRPTTVFLGGGTPSLLDERRLGRLFEVVRRTVDLDACAEVTMEANPESFTLAKARLAHAAGVRRLSIGVQSFEPRHLAFLDRAHTAERAEEAFAAGRAAGFTNISIDLMFGVPGQTLAEWQSDLERALRLGPDHLSCYNLTFEAGTRLTRDMKRGLVTPNENADDAAMFEHTRTRLAAAGYDAYEISNFAGRGGPSRHNDHYWLQGDYVGVGPGASSHRAGVRWTSLKAVEPWAEAALAGLPTAASAETLRPRQRLGEALWLGIRRRDGVSLRAIEARLGVRADEALLAILARHRGAGLLTADPDVVRLTAAGLLVADRIGGDVLAAG